MKKVISLLLILAMSVVVSACFRRDELEDVVIYTTVFPIEFLTQVLYGYNSEVLSIYPDGVDVREYTLTDKQIRDFSEAAIFVYNGLSREREIARSFINNNRNMRIIDVAYGLRYTHAVEELWLSPNNFLMLATTIRNNLQEYITNKYIREEIQANYVEKLEGPLSQMDADLRRIGRLSGEDGNNTLIVSSVVFRFLENYGFNVIVLDDEDNLTPNNLSAIKNNFDSEAYKYIFLRSDEEESDLIKDLVANHNAEVIVFNIMSNISDEDRRANETYFTFMNINIENIRMATMGR